jgi:hypothetical protein
MSLGLVLVRLAQQTSGARTLRTSAPVVCHPQDGCMTRHEPACPALSQGSIQGSVLSKSSPTEPDLTPANTGHPAPPDPLGRPHNPKVAGSNPAPAMRRSPARAGFFRGRSGWQPVGCLYSIGGAGGECPSREKPLETDACVQSTGPQQSRQRSTAGERKTAAFQSPIEFWHPTGCWMWRRFGRSAGTGEHLRCWRRSSQGTWPHRHQVPRPAS